MGCCASNLKMDMQRSLDGSIYASKRSRSGSNSSNGSGSASVASGSPNGSNSSGLGSACSTPQRSSNRSIWSRSANQTRPIPICDDFAEQPTQVLDRSYGYHTCSTSTSSSACSTPSKRQLRCTQEMDNYNSQNNSCEDEEEQEEGEVPAVGNLEWEMHMMQQAQPIMCKTSSPLCQRRLQSPPVGGNRQQQLQHDPNSRSYHKWRNYLQCTPVHMLHNVSHIPEAIAGQFCPIDFPAFSDLEEMESAAKRYKVDRGHHQDQHESRDYQQLRMQQQLTHTISTDL
ncbi:uncharacterized protein LOC117573390 [Drosophila albomicans]|uniref:Uncharacterized protein LOC117573390 n=1 Tax=Drosophila albomicans TaxID=7291 RepID=A0A6P8XM55_DROAB|nr:uncharacterized protein LOC117573390 [Drosophila albomicans]